MAVKPQLKKRLIALADRYENPSFYDGDPSQFLRHYSARADIECAALTAALLAFGSRKQFIPKIAFILETADASSGSISRWLGSGNFRKDFPHGEKKFYRFYSYDDMHAYFEELRSILAEEKTLGEYFRKKLLKESPDAHLADIIASSFPRSSIVPKGKNSANKRIHMFLRWMVRKDSPVDLGLWTWYGPEKLIMPLDVHVMQEAAGLGLILEDSRATRKTALSLTQALGEVFPGDPVRGDYALFGLGVDETRK